MFSWLSRRRAMALCVKETRQILRDPSSWLIAVVLPLVLLTIFGYGINLDTNRLRLGVVIEQRSELSTDFVNSLISSPFVEPTIADSRALLMDQMQTGKIRGIVVVPVDFDLRMIRYKSAMPVQVITDATDANTANFVRGYVQGIWHEWQALQAITRGNTIQPLINVQARFWFNPAAISRHFIIPGAITIIMTVLGAILTSLVVAREWERGTMEALLSTEVTRMELLLCKLVPYYFLGMLAMGLCMLVAIYVLDVPWRGSLLFLLSIGSLFLINTLGLGLLISTVIRSQFNAAQTAMNAVFLPSVMLSGFIFQISSMPEAIQLVTYLIPARYFVSTLQSLFLAGDIYPVLIFNALSLIVFAVALFGLTAFKTQRRLE